MPIISDEKLVSLIDSLYEASSGVSSAPWVHVFKQTAELVGSSAGAFSVFDERKMQFTCMAGTFSPKFTSLYNDYYQTVCPYRSAINSVGLGEVFNRQRYVDDNAFKKTEFYSDYMRREKVFHLEYHPFIKENGLVGSISFSRPLGSPNFERRETAVVKTLLPHFRRAFHLYIKMANLDRDKCMLEDAFDRMPQMVIVIDKDRKVVFANKTARDLLSRRDGLATDKSSRLNASSSQDQSRLQLIIESVFAEKSLHEQGPGGLVTISRPSGKRHLECMISPFRDDPHFPSGRGPLAIAFVSDPERRHETAESVLRQLHAFTSAEARFAALLARGISLKEIGSILEISQNTARTHLKNIFCKTGTHRQSELIKLILSGSASRKV